MQRILLALRQALRQRILVLGLMTLLSLSSLFTFVSAPVYATTLEELKLTPATERLTPEEKIERAYDFNEGAGIIEERKQEAIKAEAGIKEKGDDENLKAYEDKPEPLLIEKAQNLVKKVTGN